MATTYTQEDLQEALNRIINTDKRICLSCGKITEDNVCYCDWDD